MRLQDQLNVIRRHQTRVPVPVTEIAAALGIKCFETSSWGDNLSGKIERAGESFEITINSKHPLVRQRFTLAHEIAHAVLHPDLIGDGIADDARWRSGLPDPVEYQANRMAAQILMPEHLLRQEFSKGYTTAAALAERFKVSKQSMQIRMEQVGLGT